MDKKLIDFFLEVGRVKRQKQRGLVLRGVKEPATIGGHSFREAIMGWTIAKASNTGLDPDRVIKIVLVRDLCAGYAGDSTPYDPLLKKRRGKASKKVFEKWVRLSKKEKERSLQKRRKEEQKSLEALIKKLPPTLVNEIKNLWIELEYGKTKEGRFVQQLHMLENFLQALEYWKKDKKFPIKSQWQQMKELTSDPFLVELLQELDKTFYQKS